MNAKILTAIATASILALTALILQPFPHSAAQAHTGDRSASFQLLSAVLADADAKGTLSDALNNLLADMFIEYLIAPQTGETVQQARARLSVQGQSTLQLLNAVLADADDKGTLSDALNNLLADMFIEYLISPQTGETVQQARARLSAPADAGSPATDRAALTALYNATDGPNWSRANTNWLTDKPLDEWRGVTTDANSRVTELLLWDNNLTGSIPPELGNLTKLETLYLDRNQLSGPIPSEIGSLSNLNYLALNGNQLTGSIPPELGNLTKLETLYLDRNQLSGPIPSQLGNLTKLEALYLNRNQLSGPIPSELGSLSNLRSLYLRDNELSGCIPNALGDTQRNDLSELSLSFCSPRPSDPSDKAILEAFYNATGGTNWATSINWLTDKPLGLWYGVATDSDGRVTGLRLRTNNLSGSIPTNLGSLSNMESLSLDRNQLTGAIPPQLGSLSNLEYLNLEDNQLTGAVPTELGNLSNLQWLYLRNNDLSGPLPQSLTGITALRVFRFTGNSGDLCVPDDAAFQAWIQAIPYLSRSNNCPTTDRAALTALYNATDGPNWTNNTNWLSDQPLWSWHGVNTDDNGRVTRLILRGSQMSGEIPTELGNLTNLEDLNLDSNQLSGSIPTELGSLDNLKYLSIQVNRLSGPIPPELGNLSNLIGLYLYNNQLSGSIPTELGSLDNLEYLSIQVNRLSGSIPPELGNLSNLTELHFYNNQLSGSIPTELGNLTSLESLYLDNNQLSGSVPTEIGNLSNLTELHLYSNQLSGTIPFQLGSLTNLQRLYLNDNQLSGAIPPQLGNLTNLEYLLLHENRLSGGIPSQLGNLTNLERLQLSGNDDLTGCVPAALSDVPDNDFADLGLPFCAQ